MDYKQFGLWRQLWTNRNRIAVTKTFGTTGISEAKALHSIHWGEKFLAKVSYQKEHDTRNTFETNIWSSKLLQQLFYSIHRETMEPIIARTSEHWVQWPLHWFTDKTFKSTEVASFSFFFIIIIVILFFVLFSLITVG